MKLENRHKKSSGFEPELTQLRINQFLCLIIFSYQNVCYILICKYTIINTNNITKYSILYFKIYNLKHNENKKILNTNNQHITQ